MRIHKRISNAVIALCKVDPESLQKYLAIGQELMARIPDGEIPRKSTGKARKPRKTSRKRRASSTPTPAV